MIKAQELRHGCWIKTANGYEQVVDVLCDSVNTKTLQNELYDNIRPIELTPELMGKIKGFSPSSIGYHIIVKNEDGVLIKLYIELTPTGNEFTYFKRFMRGDIEFRLDWEIKYLHQLQNVVYFFTGGMELEITL